MKFLRVYEKTSRQHLRSLCFQTKHSHILLSVIILSSWTWIVSYSCSLRPFYFPLEEITRSQADFMCFLPHGRNQSQSEALCKYVKLFISMAALEFHVGIRHSIHQLSSLVIYIWKERFNRLLMDFDKLKKPQNDRAIAALSQVLQLFIQNSSYAKRVLMDKVCSAYKYSLFCRLVFSVLFRLSPLQKFNFAWVVKFLSVTAVDQLKRQLGVSC